MMIHNDDETYDEFASVTTTAQSSRELPKHGSEITLLLFWSLCMPYYSYVDLVGDGLLVRAAPISIQMVPAAAYERYYSSPHTLIFPRKRLAQDYLPWIERLSMTLQDNMIIFTSHDQVPLFKKLREHQRNTRVIPMALDETHVVQDFGGMDFWQRQSDLDPEK
jgi:hypothetical protein